MQFEYQADQLLISKMVILLKDQDKEDEEEKDGNFNSSSKGVSEPRRHLLVKKSPEGQKHLLVKKSPEGREHLLVRKSQAGQKNGSSSPLDRNDGDGAVDNGKSASLGTGRGFLWFLKKKDKKNTNKATPRKIEVAPRKQEASPAWQQQRPPSRESHKEVRKVLALEAERLRNQKQAQDQTDHASHPRFRPSPNAQHRSPRAHHALSPEEKAKQNEEAQRIIEQMLTQQVGSSQGQQSTTLAKDEPRVGLVTPSTPTLSDSPSHQQQPSKSAMKGGKASPAPSVTSPSPKPPLKNGTISPVPRPVTPSSSSQPSRDGRISPPTRPATLSFSNQPPKDGRISPASRPVTPSSPSHQPQPVRSAMKGGRASPASRPITPSSRGSDISVHDVVNQAPSVPRSPIQSPASASRSPHGYQQRDNWSGGARPTGTGPVAREMNRRASPAGPGEREVTSPKVQQTEQLLHAERTHHKPPLPTKGKGASIKDKKTAPPSQKGKTYCQSCKKKCSGEVLRVQDKYFHIACFKCKVCRNSLAQGGFFCKDGGYYCTADYQRQFGTKCAVCGDYVEGEVVSALGNTYHQKCFTCGRCRQPFPSGERVTYTGKEVLCAKCVQIPVRDARVLSSQSSTTSADGAAECAGCHEELKECQALIALDRQWHIWCFKCKACEGVLHGEYMGKDGVPYCEKDYQKMFGVKCAYCNRYISGKVLQAGDNHHFHPTCARCTKCGDPFGDGEEMYLQGGAIWHPRCGPGPTENGAVLNGVENGHCTDTETEGESGRDIAFDRMSSSAVSDMQFSIRSRTPSLNGSYNSLSRKYQYQRTGSPGLILREYNKHQYPEDISRILTYSYLTEEPTQGYLKRPIDPYDKPPTSPHFHRPSSAHSGRSSKVGHMSKHGSRTGMAVLVDSIRSETPRPRSPHMNNEEPIELAHFPAAKPPQPGEPPKIEREDFPAPPYPYTDPERRRRWSDSYKGVPISDDDDDTDGKTDKELEDKKLKREEKELSKIATGIGKVFLHNVREREKLRQWKMHNMDPRNASRSPSAAREPTYRLRYQSPVNASPSRNVDHPRPWEEDEMIDRSSSYRSSVGRSVGAIPSYNVVSSLRSPPKPGYGLKSCTLPAAGRNGGFMGYPVSPDQGDFSFSGLGEKTHSTEFSSGKSDISAGSISEVDRRALNAELHASTTYTGGLGALRSASYSPHLRRSLPNMTHSNVSEPPKIYPYHLLVITNYRLPVDVDRCNLERHLSDAEFEYIFGYSRVDFYRLPQWRRNELKRRARLF